jgi:CheY-like chemotaxis protein
MRITGTTIRHGRPTPAVLLRRIAGGRTTGACLPMPAGLSHRFYFRGPSSSARLRYLEGIYIKTENQRVTSSPTKLVLVIDDDRSARSAMEVLLTAWGYRTVVAESLADARAQLKQAGMVPLAVIADYRLREGPGTDAISALKMEYGAALPASLISGDIDSAVFARIASEGVVHLQKPVSAAKLRELLKTFLGAAESG